MEIRCGNTAIEAGGGGVSGEIQIPLKSPEPGAASQTSIVLLSPGVVVVPSTTVPLLSEGEVVVWATTVMDEKEEEKMVSDSIVPSTSFSVVVCLAGDVVVDVSSEDAVASVDVVVVVLVVGHTDGVGVIAVVLNPLQ